jgi:hypothetical protein
LSLSFGVSQKGIGVDPIFISVKPCVQAPKLLFKGIGVDPCPQTLKRRHKAL